MDKNETIDEEINKLEQAITQYLPTEDVLQTIAEGLKANKVISAMVIAPDGEGMKDAHSMTRDFVDVPDWANRLKAADMASRLKSMYPPEKKKIEEDVTFRDGEGKIYFPYTEQKVEAGGNGGNGHGSK